VKVFIALLVIAFVAGGSARTRVVLRRPLVLVALCVVVAASFWSRRVVG
jgi:hypothetical protein